MIHPLDIERRLSFDQEARETKKRKKKRTYSPEEPIIENIKAHRTYRKAWRRAIRNGAIGGRTCTEATVKKYRHHVNKYIKQYGDLDIISIHQFVLADVPPEQHSKQQDRRKAIVSFIKYLVHIEVLTKEFMEKMNEKVVIPKRVGEPKRPKV